MSNIAAGPQRTWCKLLRAVSMTVSLRGGAESKFSWRSGLLAQGAIGRAAARWTQRASLAGLGDLGEVLWAALLRCCDAINRPNQNWRAVGA